MEEELDPEQVVSELLEVGNEIMIHLGIGNQTTELDDILSDRFYLQFIHEAFPDVYPKLGFQDGDQRGNVERIISFLSTYVLEMDLSEIDGGEIINGHVQHIANLMNILFQLALHIHQQRETQLEEEENLRASLHVEGGDSGGEREYSEPILGEAQALPHQRKESRRSSAPSQYFQPQMTMNEMMIESCIIKRSVSASALQNVDIENSHLDMLFQDLMSIKSMGGGMNIFSPFPAHREDNIIDWGGQGIEEIYGGEVEESRKGSIKVWEGVQGVNIHTPSPPTPPSVVKDVNVVDAEIRVPREVAPREMGSSGEKGKRSTSLDNCDEYGEGKEGDQWNISPKAPKNSKMLFGGDSLHESIPSATAHKSRLTDSGGVLSAGSQGNKRRPQHFVFPEEGEGEGEGNSEWENNPEHILDIGGIIDLTSSNNTEKRTQGEEILLIEDQEATADILGSDLIGEGVITPGEVFPGAREGLLGYRDGQLIQIESDTDIKYMLQSSGGPESEESEQEVGVGEGIYAGKLQIKPDPLYKEEEYIAVDHLREEMRYMEEGAEGEFIGDNGEKVVVEDTLTPSSEVLDIGGEMREITPVVPIVVDPPLNKEGDRKEESSQDDDSDRIIIQQPIYKKVVKVKDNNRNRGRKGRPFSASRERGERGERERGERERENNTRERERGERERENNTRERENKSRERVPSKDRGPRGRIPRTSSKERGLQRIPKVIKRETNTGKLPQSRPSTSKGKTRPKPKTVKAAKTAKTVRNLPRPKFRGGGDQIESGENSPIIKSQSSTKVRSSLNSSFSINRASQVYSQKLQFNQYKKNVRSMNRPKSAPRFRWEHSHQAHLDMGGYRGDNSTSQTNSTKKSIMSKSKLNQMVEYTGTTEKDQLLNEIKNKSDYFGILDGDKENMDANLAKHPIKGEPQHLSQIQHYKDIVNAATKPLKQSSRSSSRRTHTKTHVSTEITSISNLYLEELQKIQQLATVMIYIYIYIYRKGYKIDSNHITKYIKP